MPGPRGLVQQLDQQLHQSGLLPRGARLLVAVSGGADSVALLRLLVEINRSNYWKWELGVAHVDHGMRGRASREDARFVGDLARSLDLPLELERHKLPSDASEETARDARLGSFRTMCRALVRGRWPWRGVITAHHADDQAETVLMRMFRGTGIHGMSAMAPQSDVQGLTLLRPLLQTRRSDLRDHLRQIEQPWREDASNASGLYLRNRLRHQLMPFIQVMWPRSVEALGRLAVLAAEASAALEADAHAFMQQTPAWGGKRVVQFPRQALQDLPPAVASEVLRLVIAALGGTPETADFERLREALRILRGSHGGKQVEVGAGIVISAGDGLVRIRRGAIKKRRPPGGPR